MRCPDLLRYFNSDLLGNALLYDAVYSISSGTSHSAQYALAAMLKAVNDGQIDFVSIVREYGEKAKVMKRLACWAAIPGPIGRHSFRIGSLPKRGRCR